MAAKVLQPHILSFCTQSPMLSVTCVAVSVISIAPVRHLILRLVIGYFRALYQNCYSGDWNRNRGNQNLYCGVVQQFPCFPLLMTRDRVEFPKPGLLYCATLLCQSLAVRSRAKDNAALQAAAGGRIGLVCQSSPRSNFSPSDLQRLRRPNS